MNCSIRGCPGYYEKKFIPHVLKHKGEFIVLENMPADVCSVCGDILISVDTAEAIESVLKDSVKPLKTVPLYRMSEMQIAA